MTSPSSTAPSSRTHGARARRGSAAGRPALFLAITAVAGLIVLWILLSGPAMPLPVALPAMAAVLLLLMAGWRLAGPRR